MIRENITLSIKGAAALSEALDQIGGHEKSDHDLAKVIVENELSLREFLRWGLYRLATDQ